MLLGFIGSHTVDLLLSLGHTVIGIDNLRTGSMNNLSHALMNERFYFLNKDVTDETSMYELFANNDFDGILHLAALVSVPESFDNPEDNAKINLYASDTLARLCVYFNVPKMVFASSAAVYAGLDKIQAYDERTVAPISPYGTAKLAAETMIQGYVKSHGLEAICFRYFNVYGTRQSFNSPYSGAIAIFTDKFKKGEQVTVFGDGSQVRDFISVDDIARFNVTALISRYISGVYNACTGTMTSINKILEILKEVYPYSPKVLYTDPRQGDPVFSLGDHYKLNNEMRLAARIPFDVGLRKLIEETK